jgi:hypothetical protein
MLMEKKEKKVNLIMAVIISLCMGILFTFITRGHADPKALESMPPAPAAYLISILESVVVGVIVAFIIPMGKIGRAMTSKAGVRPPSLPFTLINSIPFAVINAILVSAVCSFLGVASSYKHIMDPNKAPLFLMWATNWLKLLPISIIVSYVLAVIISPIVVKAVGLGGPGGPGGPGRPGGPAGHEGPGGPPER